MPILRASLHPAKTLFMDPLALPRPDYSHPYPLGQVYRPVLPTALWPAEQAAESDAVANSEAAAGLKEALPPQPNAFWAQPFRAEPVRMGDFVGATALGGVVNFFDWWLNPHGNGTHTECVGHISKERIVLCDCLTHFAFYADVVTVAPRELPAPAPFSGRDAVVTAADLQAAVQGLTAKLGAAAQSSPALASPARASPPLALVLRTAPEAERRNRHWTGTNAPYVEAAACAWLADQGYDHLLLDLPSVDREADQGLLAAHHAWWRYPHATRMQATITEMIVVPDALPDGRYWLHMQVAQVAMDAAPSNPVLYRLGD
ncbi:MAG: cyclase family protein [Bacteroidetes bacterium]|nr:cyclase family protein [Bacteroidota bacterium]